MVYIVHEERSGPEATNEMKFQSYLRKLPRFTVATLRFITMNSIFLEFLNLALVGIQGIKSWLGARPRNIMYVLLASVYKQAVWQILMQISVQVANPHAHFYISVNKDDKQMNKTYDKMLHDSANNNFALKKTNSCTVIDRILHCSEWTSWTVKRGKNLILIGLFFKSNLG